MRALIVAILMLSLASSLEQYPNLKTQVGQPCASSGYTKIVSFDVEPWPPVISEGSTITIKAEFTKPNTGVRDITIGTLVNFQTWTYQYFDVGQMFPQNSIQTFQYDIFAPNSIGNYVIQVTINGVDIPPTIDACWAYSFSFS
ncbi:hypothetical protein SteCoe_26204 [Stentor coeruleus]|uniref:MD-2-related lipid-recognition domain-containing protein n=1 Tax=Stentor coeruleus TaxID=5963 RepID=A0A1R2BDE3_9CILI|nr:hypothetical protein SteCoe_26204 [Stentor coeruleus]